MVTRRHRIQFCAKGLALFATYAVIARLSLKLGAVSGFATLVWPPTGIALAALLVGGIRCWPAIAAAAFAVNWSLGAPPAAALGMGAGNALEAVVGAWLLGAARFDPRLERLRDVLAFVALAALLSTLTSATIGVTSLLLGGTIHLDAFRPTWTAWWLGDVMGDLLVAPLLLLWSRKAEPGRAETRPLPELAAVLGLIALGGITIFSDLIVRRETGFPHPYFAFPLLMLVALRYDVRWTVTATTALAAVVIMATATGHGRFWAAGTLSDRLLQAQLFLGVVATTVLVLAAAVTERRRSEERRERSEENQRFLKEATQHLFESIDYRTTLKHVAQAAVPQFADICVVRALRDDGKLEPLEVTCGIPEKEALLRELVAGYNSDPEGPTLLAAVVRHKESRLINAANDDDYRAISRNERHFQLLRQLAFRSVIASPILSRERVVGAIAVVSCRAGVTYGPEDLAVLEELARRAAIAIENSKLYLEAQEAVFARDEFLSIASHELRTPLTALLLRLQAFNRGVQKQFRSETVTLPARTVLGLTSAEAQTRKLATLLDELLDLTRIRLGRLQLSRERVDLGELVCEVVERFRVETSGQGIAVSVEASAGLVGHWDRMRIDQVVTNLISNAIKYGEGKPISIAVEKGDGRGLARLAVRDGGRGVPPELQDRIFERFERADSTGRTVPGLGLGLYIARQIVTAHGGSIRVETEASRGSTFTVELPPA